MKIAGETNMMIMEIENNILKVSINNQTINATNILEISDNWQHLIQSNIEDWVFQIQRMLANELDVYKRQENHYVDDHIWEIQDLYKDKEDKKKERVEDKEVILIKPYEIDKSTSATTKSSFINDKVNNLIKYIKFIHSSTQTRMFQPLLYYQSLKSREEQDPKFWKEVATALVKNNYNTKTLQNGYPIAMYQGGLPHEPYFIAIDNQDQVIISPNKKMVTIYMVGELKMLVWFIGI